MAAIARLAGGNIRLIQRLFTQIGRVLSINELTVVTANFVEPASSILVLGAHNALETPPVADDSHRPDAHTHLRGRGFRVQLVWEENRRLPDTGGSAGDPSRDSGSEPADDPEADQATALVPVDRRNRELDVHVLHPSRDDLLVAAWRTDHELGPAALAYGAIGAITAIYLSPAAQLAGHSG